MGRKGGMIIPFVLKDQEMDFLKWLPTDGLGWGISWMTNFGQDKQDTHTSPRSGWPSSRGQLSDALVTTTPSSNQFSLWFFVTYAVPEI